MKVLQTVMTLLLFIISAGVLAEPATVLDSVQDAVKSKIERQEIRAAVLGTQSGDKNRVTGYGQVSRSNEHIPAPSTLFEIGSITKVFTAILAQQQVAAGRADWDEPISQRIKGNFASAQVAAITWRELASHTSGLPRMPDNMPMEDPLDPFGGYDRPLLEAFLMGYAPDSLDKSYEYSNLGAGLLGELAAQAAGLSYADALERDVFKPLGLDDTQVAVSDAQAKQMATGFSQGADMPRWSSFDALAGAGAVVSSASDLLAFARLTLNPDQAGAMADTLTAVLEPQGSGETGLGWHRKMSDAGTPLYWHNGGTGGFASVLVLNPESNETVVLLASSTDYGGVTNLAFTQMAGVSEVPESDLDLSIYEGAYEAAPGMVLTFFVNDGQLFGQATGQGAFPLTSDSDHQFVFAPADIAITFDEFKDNQAQRMTIVQAGNTTRAPRVAAEKGIQQRKVIEVSSDALAGLAGVYELAPGVTITVETRDGQLFAQLSGQSAFPVFPFAKDQFFYKVVDAELHFERQDDGDVKGVTLVQGGRQFAPRKK
ncbi:MAG: serine hydrolase [Lysobacterales bacterium]